VNALRHKIEQEIGEHGPIPFSRYMEVCLYDDEHGYYSRNAAQFGKAGDFYTSSDVHAVFGRLMARQFEEMWRALGCPETIVLNEFGPGRGLFAQDVLDWSEKKFPDFFRALRYVLVERSPALRERIEQTLKRHIDAGKAEVSAASELEYQDKKSRFLDFAELPASGQFRFARNDRTGLSQSEFPTIIFANEFFDALPVEIISTQGSLRIDMRDGRFVETWVRSSDEELEFLDRYSIHPEGDEKIEVALAAQRYAEAMLRDVGQGFFMAIDYGYTRDEQLAGRHRGTVKAIRKHSVSANPYEATGEQDITADVNFTALAAAAEKSGWNAQKLITQSQFLLGVGEANQFADAFEDCRLPQERAKVALQLKHLVTPAGMGESFHVFVASKRIETERVLKLAGLSFGRR
jgi:SAM-dependent MidA family methyltransferase